MKRLTGILAFLVMSVLLATSPAIADWSFHIRNDNRDATWEIWLLTGETGSLTTSGFQLAFDFDEHDGKVSWNNTDYSISAPSPMTPWTPSFNNGMIIDFSAAVPLPPPPDGSTATIGEDTRIGTLTLTYADGLLPDPKDFFWAADPTEFYANINGGYYSGQDLFERGHLTTAPVPGALWLLGSGLVGLSGARFRKGERWFARS